MNARQDSRSSRAIYRIPKQCMYIIISYDLENRQYMSDHENDELVTEKTPHGFVNIILV